MPRGEPFPLRGSGEAPTGGQDPPRGAAGPELPMLLPGTGRGLGGSQPYPRVGARGARLRTTVGWGKMTALM